MTFADTISRKETDKWIIAMEDELKLTQCNKVWKLVDLLEYINQSVVNDYLRPIKIL